MRAGHILVRSCLRSRYARGELIYPMFFCYRHGLEAAMKWIISQYGASAGVPSYEPNHNLSQLWKACRIVLSSAASDGERDTNALVGRIIEEYHQLDPRNVSFRYSTDKSGRLIKLREGSTDLRNLLNVMTGVHHFFNGADVWLSELARFDDEFDYDQ